MQKVELKHLNISPENLDKFFIPGKILGIRMLDTDYLTISGFCLNEGEFIL